MRGTLQTTDSTNEKDNERDILIIRLNLVSFHNTLEHVHTIKERCINAAKFRSKRYESCLAGSHWSQGFEHDLLSQSHRQ